MDNPENLLPDWNANVETPKPYRQSQSDRNSNLNKITSTKHLSLCNKHIFSFSIHPSKALDLKNGSASRKRKNKVSRIDIHLSLRIYCEESQHDQCLRMEKHRHPSIIVVGFNTRLCI